MWHQTELRSTLRPVHVREVGRASPSRELLGLQKGLPQRKQYMSSCRVSLSGWIWYIKQQSEHPTRLRLSVRRPLAPRRGGPGLSGGGPERPGRSELQRGPLCRPKGRRLGSRSLVRRRPGEREANRIGSQKGGIVGNVGRGLGGRLVM